jgi:hypothetical protein
MTTMVKIGSQGRQNATSPPFARPERRANATQFNTGQRLVADFHAKNTLKMGGHFRA